MKWAALILLLLVSCGGGGGGSSSSDSSTDDTTSGTRIEETNADVDFDRLVVGELMSLSAPDPTASTSINKIIKQIDLAEECSCAWDVTPSDTGSFSDDRECDTNLVLTSARSGTISVVVDCGSLGKGTFTQDYASFGDSTDDSDDSTIDSDDVIEETDDDEDVGSSSDVCSAFLISKKFIVNGTNCDEANHPVVPMLFYGFDFNVYLCTGTFITKNTVLTAAHCINNSLLGFVYYNNEYYKTDGGFYHASFFTSVSHPNDIAVVYLEENVDVTPVPIIVSRFASIGERIQIMGYGLTEDDFTNIDKAKNSIELVGGEMDVTSSLSTGFYGESILTNQTTCSGDSGGPAFATVSGVKGILGITSSGDCETITFFVAPQSTSNLDFLNETVPDATGI